MESIFHTDPVIRERCIARYLAKTLGEGEAQQFEDHYLFCDDCFEEMRATGLLLSGLGQPAIHSEQTGDVTVIRFSAKAQLTSTAGELAALQQVLYTRGDTKVLIDLQGVSRVDSTGLGMLMRCYAHAVRHSGAFKLLLPAPQVKRVLSMTKIDSVIPV